MDISEGGTPSFHFDELVNEMKALICFPSFPLS